MNGGRRTFDRLKRLYGALRYRKTASARGPVDVWHCRVCGGPYFDPISAVAGICSDRCREIESGVEDASRPIWFQPVRPVDEPAQSRPVRVGWFGRRDVGPDGSVW